jgi:hypothetical protein
MKKYVLTCYLEGKRRIFGDFRPIAVIHSVYTRYAIRMDLAFLARQAFPIDRPTKRCDRVSWRPEARRSERA